MKIIITGTPGTGKTTITKILAKKLKTPIINNETLKKTLTIRKEENGEHVINHEEINKITKKHKNYILDSHIGHYDENADICIVLTCDQKTLIKRLKNKKFNKQKIKQNLEAENFKTCYYEAKEKGHKPIIINTTNQTPQQTAKKIEKIINQHTKTLKNYQKK